MRRSGVFEAAIDLDSPTDDLPFYAKSESELREIMQYLDHNVLLSNLPLTDKERVAGALQARVYPAEASLMTQGEQGRHFIVLQSGTADIQVNGQSVGHYQAGDYMGELALLHGCTHEATVVAETDCIAWVLDRASFQRVVIASASDRMKRHVGFVDSIELFASLPQRTREAIAGALKTVHLSAGDLLIAEDDADAAECYIVESGELAVTKAGVDGDVWHRLTAGDIVGERALVLNEVCDAHARRHARRNGAALHLDL